VRKKKTYLKQRDKDILFFMYARQMHLAKMWLFADAMLTNNPRNGIIVSRCY
jgi:hypothetical protein